MKTTQLIIALFFLVHNAWAHVVFHSLVVNGTVTEQWQYVRDVAGRLSDSSKDNPQVGPLVYGPNITCGRLAYRSAKNTSTATVLAGSEIGFKHSEIFHPGWVQIYLGKVPGDVALEDTVGDELDFFKIASFTSRKDNETEWDRFHTFGINFTIPETTPPGKYLLRIENAWPSQEVSLPQWYVNCAHVDIVGPGGGVPIGFARFPGTYKMDDPGIWVSGTIAGYPEKNLKDFIAPGPPVWTG